MAPSSNNMCILIALLAAVAVVQPSAAIRAEVAARAWVNAGQGAAAPPSGGDDGLPPLPPQPTECRPLLMPMVPPCAGFLTNSSVYDLPSGCCDAFNAMRNPEKVTCVCHVVNGDIAQLLPAPLHHSRLGEMFLLCGLGLPVETLAQTCKSTAIPPMDAASPPPLAPWNKAPSPAPSVLITMSNSKVFDNSDVKSNMIRGVKFRDNQSVWCA
ncbi:hypothetical protein ACP4OV_014316 [Aristida adscensionis]